MDIQGSNSLVREIERMYEILRELKLLENNTSHESDVNLSNLRMGIRYLTSFYGEMQMDEIERMKKVNTERENKY